MKSWVGCSAFLMLASVAVGFLSPFHHRDPVSYSIVSSISQSSSSISPYRWQKRDMVASDVEATELASSASQQEPLLSSLRLAWIEALQNGELTEMNKLMSPIKWTSPVAGKTEEEIKDSARQFSEFFSEPNVMFFGTKDIDDSTFTTRFQLSFWYPTPWRPRIIIPGELIVKKDGKDRILSVEEKWDLSLADIFAQQMLPRFWDMWHSFSSPTPEYPPIKTLGTAGKVKFEEMPETMVIDIVWQGLASLPGPPLLALPGFALFGFLKTSRPNRDPYYTVLPVEVESGKFMNSEGRAFKQSSWTMHVPTSLQGVVLDKVASGELHEIGKTSLLTDEDTMDSESDLEAEVDYQVGLENIDVMKSIKGASRGQGVDFDETIMKSFEEAESISYRYKIIPKRILATIEIKGDPTSAKISEQLKELKKTISTESSNLFGKQVYMKSLDVKDTDGTSDSSPKFGIQMWNCKGGFNNKAEPAMAVYEMQYGYRSTKVYIELEM